MNLTDLKKEIIGVALIGAFLFLFVSLLSYHPLDPSFHTVTDTSARNLCGKAGSYISDVLIQLVGLMSYVLISFALVFGIFYVRKKDPPSIIVFSSGLVMFFLSIGTLLQTLIGRVHIRGMPVEFSGFLGSILERALMNFFGRFGTILIAVVLLLISAFLIVQAPILGIIEERVARRKKAERRREIKVTREKKEEELPPKPAEKKAAAAVQETFEFFKEIGPYKLPDISLLDTIEKKETKVDKDSIQANASILEKKLQDYGID